MNDIVFYQSHDENVSLNDQDLNFYDDNEVALIERERVDLPSTQTSSNYEIDATRSYLVPDRKSHFSKKNQIRIKKYFLKKFSEPEKSLISQLTSQYSELFL